MAASTVPTLREMIAEKIKELGPETEEKLVDSLVGRELTKRSDALVKAFDMLGKMEGEERKMKPDQVFFTGVEDKEPYTMYSKNKLEELKKHRQKIEKLTGLINKALDKEDFNDLYQYVKSGGEDKSGENKSEGGEKIEE